MRKELVLNVPPFSINRMYYSDLKAKTADAREWSAQVLFQLGFADNKAALKELREFFDPKLHAFRLELAAFYPKEVYYNKENTISGRTQDITNWEKPITDLIFGTKYFDKPAPYGAENVNHDDRYIYSCLSKKLPHDLEQCKILVTIEIISLEQILHQK